MPCRVPDQMCPECTATYEYLEYSELAANRDPGPNRHPIVFTRWIFNTTDRDIIFKLRTNFIRNVRYLSGIDVGVPLVSNSRYPEGAPNGATMSVSVLLDLPKPLRFLDTDPADILANLDDLFGHIPNQPPGYHWEYCQPRPEDDACWFRLGWLERLSMTLENERTAGYEE
ncbi:uncharacterized protein BJX67DRAFT_382306 [Aspergillus lucknowensis]|uniref:Uncharacterized protein n=1 Tax=Aspergillus lucknowensis TaxID=176173 RepID=A0ABR4LNE1_9EURO